MEIKTFDQWLNESVDNGYSHSILLNCIKGQDMEWKDEIDQYYGVDYDSTSDEEQAWWIIENFWPANFALHYIPYMNAADIAKHATLKSLDDLKTRKVLSDDFFNTHRSVIKAKKYNL